MMQNHAETTKKSYGIFALNDYLIWEISNFKIQIKTIDDTKYSYLRTTDDNIITSKIFTSKSSKIRIEVAPILPQNLPDKITNYIMLKFNEGLQIEKKSNVKFDVLLPIEIGVFAIFEEERSLIECFSIDPLSSRYGMYGTPDSGVLCKCFRVSLDNKVQTTFLNSKISLDFQNETTENILISKIVFLATNHDLFYNSKETITEGINCILKDTLGSKSAQIISQQLELPSGFNMSPKIEQKTSESFIMDGGLL